MATKTEIRLIDDLDPTKDADETVDFGLDGRSYLIDLTADNANELRALLDGYISAARQGKNGKVKRSYTRREPKAPATPQFTSGKVPNGASAPLALTPEARAMVRKWAQENPTVHGFKVSDRGRLPDGVYAAYNAAHAGASG
jgi:hypothetical protein